MNMRELIIQITFFILMYTAQLIIFAFVRKAHSAKRSNLTLYVVGFALALFHAGIQQLHIEGYSFYILSNMLESGAILYCFPVTYRQACFHGCFFSFHFLFSNSFSMLVISSLTSFKLTLICQYAGILCFLMILGLYWRHRQDERIRYFLTNREQMLETTIYQLTLMIMLLLNTYHLDHLSEATDMMKLQAILVSILVFGFYLVVMNYGIRISYLHQKEIRSQSQLETIKRQVNQQNSLLNITRIINAFKHDYREQLLSIEYFINHHDYEKAKEAIHVNYLEQLNFLSEAKKYSNNVILNSLFIDRQEVCNKRGVRLEALLYLPPEITASEREIHEIMRILTQNGMEANEHVRQEKRYLTITSGIGENWMTIKVENPYDGLITFDGDRPASNWGSTKTRGMGLVFVETLIESLGGVIAYQVDELEKKFMVLLLIPIVEGKEED